jgi:hypothetical protein
METEAFDTVYDYVRGILGERVVLEFLDKDTAFYEHKFNREDTKGEYYISYGYVSTLEIGTPIEFGNADELAYILIASTNGDSWDEINTAITTGAATLFS